MAVGIRVLTGSESDLRVPEGRVPAIPGYPRDSGRGTSSIIKCVADHRDGLRLTTNSPNDKRSTRKLIVLYFILKVACIWL